jgi:segregation and condensation protein A
MFDRPLDLLLDEVRRQKVAIEEIAMAPIVARYLEYMRAAAQRDLNLDIEWLHMAATLIQWKSRALLPPDPAGNKAPDPIRDELIQQLLVHRRQAAEELARRRAVEESRFSRAPDGKPAIEPPREDSETSVWDLMQQARELAQWVENHRVRPVEWSVEVSDDGVTVTEMIDYVLGRMADSGELEGLELIHSQATASRRSCLFLGLLEMARNQQAEVEQNEAFGAIKIRRI